MTTMTTTKTTRTPKPRKTAAQKAIDAAYAHIVDGIAYTELAMVPWTVAELVEMSPHKEGPMTEAHAVLEREGVIERVGSREPATWRAVGGGR